MSISKLWSIATATALVSVAAGMVSVQAASYPTRSIELVVPFPAGGSDVVPRKISEKASAILGTAIVVVNRPGASGVIATRKVVESVPDGYTLYVSSPPELAANPSLFEKLPYDALSDLTPISLLAKTPFVLFARKDLPAKNLEDLVQYVRTNPGKLNLGTFGPGSPPDLLARIFAEQIGGEFELIPYKGGAPMITDLVGGQIDLAFLTLIPTRPFIEQGSITPLAVTLDQRPELFPNVPTFIEKGFQINQGGAWGLMGPKGLDTAIVDKLQSAFKAALADPEVKQMFSDMSIVSVGSSPDEFKASLEKDTEYWADLIPKLGLRKRSTE